MLKNNGIEKDNGIDESCFSGFTMSELWYIVDRVVPGGVSWLALKRRWFNSSNSRGCRIASWALGLDNCQIGAASYVCLAHANAWGLRVCQYDERAGHREWRNGHWAVKRERYGGYRGVFLPLLIARCYAPMRAGKFFAWAPRKFSPCIRTYMCIHELD
jgi:hypothetical protein